MNLLIDNYDSFSYNLVQLVGSLDPDIRVVRNDEVTVDEILRMHPDHLLLSPGPGPPAEPAICEPFWAFAWDIRPSVRLTAP